jgi:hypothetical protein
VSEAADRPEHIDLAKLVTARRALHAALDGLTERPTQGALAAAQDALRQVRVVNSDWLWESLEAATRRAEQTMAAEAPVDRAHRQALAWRLVEDVLADAGSDRLADDVQQIIQAGQASRVIPVVRVQVEVFVTTAEEFADQEVPPADNEEACAAWIRAAKAILEKAIDLLTNIAVAAVFTVTAVQLAAQRTVLGAAGLAEHAVSQIGPAVPLLVGITAVAAEAAIGVKLIREIWPTSHPVGRPDAIDQPRRIDPAEHPAGDPRQRAFSDAIDAAGDRLAAEDQLRSGRWGPVAEQTLWILGLEPVDASRSAINPDDPQIRLEQLAEEVEGPHPTQPPQATPPPAPGSPTPGV